MRWVWRLGGVMVVGCCVMAIGAAEPLALVVQEPLADPAVLNTTNAVRQQIEHAGYAERPVDFGALCREETFSGVDLLVLPDASTLPVDALDVVTGFLKQGGDILALNAPLGRHLLVQDGTEWVDRASFLERHRAELAGTDLSLFENGLAGWERTSNDPTIATRIELVDDAEVGKALHVRIPVLNNWDTFRSPELSAPFADGASLTVFMARGGPRTTELAVEWTEWDGSRWIATVPLTDQWQFYVLRPEDFRYWESLPSRQQDRFQPENAKWIVFGLALTHTALSGDNHEYWVAQVGTASPGTQYEPLLKHVKPPALDILCPAYKFYDARPPLALSSSFAVDNPLPTAEIVQCVHPRPQAGGFDKGRAWRWEPLVCAKDATASDPDDPLAWRGTAGALLVHADGPYTNGVWASFGVQDMTWYQTPAVLEIVRATAERMRRGVFLLDGGTNFYTYFENQPAELGARVVNTSSVPAQIAVEAALRLGTEVFERHEWKVDLAAGSVTRVATTVAVPSQAKDGIVAQVTVSVNGEQVDAAQHDVFVWVPDSQPQFMTVENGTFVYKGEPWRAHGVNYMPSSGIGTEDWDYFEQWLGARAYDPVIIDRDLRRIRDLGMNSVSIFIYHQSIHAQNLLDILRRLKSLDLLANLSLRPGTPMEFEWDKIREIIEYYRLWQHDSVFAFDLAWEPNFGSQEERRRWDSAWRDWIDERYGSLEQAEQDWGYRAPRDSEGNLTNIPGEWTLGDGPWRRVVAAYRRFLDTLLYEKYSQARDLVRRLDPHHLISFRMAEAANPTFRWDKVIPYDFPYLAGAVDFLAPEAYGRIGDWDRVKPGIFQRAYARWAAPDKPMIWAEAGVTAWVESRGEATLERLQFQGEFYAKLYRMFIESASDGIFFWWYPGGYRVNERSDYGIINPDGTDRPCTEAIRTHGKSFLEGPPAKPINYWITFDRDVYPEGVAGVYNAVQTEFWNAIAAGKTPGLRTTGTGTTSADCPLTTVGGGVYKGNAPLQYLDAVFDSAWLENGAETRLARNSTIRLHQTTSHFVLRITNLGEATWLPPEETSTGGVWLTVMDHDGKELLREPLKKRVNRFETIECAVDLALLKDNTTNGNITFRLIAENRAQFGQKFCIGVVR